MDENCKLKLQLHEMQKKGETSDLVIENRQRLQSTFYKLQKKVEGGTGGS